MAPKGGTLIFLLCITAGAALAIPPDPMPENKRDFKDMVKKLMRKCQTMGYPAPEIMQLEPVFNNSDLPMTDRNGHSGSLLSSFLNHLPSVSPNKVDNRPNKMWNFSNLPTMLKLMKNSSVATACYMQAFVGPLCWATLSENMTSEEYDAMLAAAKPALQTMMPFTRINLPTDVGKRQKLKKMMDMLKDVYGGMTKGPRTQVLSWVKEQITQKYFNCTMMPPSDPRSMQMTSCKPLLEWLNLEALTMMGPYISRLTSKDVDSSPKEQLCEFFRSAQFASAMNRTSKINPSLARKFLQRFQECFSGNQEFVENVDKLGILACYYSAAPDLTPDISSKLLSELENCDDSGNPRITQWKKHLVRSVMSNNNRTEALGKLGKMAVWMSPEQMSEIPRETLKELLKDLGPTTQWTPSQQRTLVKKLLCNACVEEHPEELVDFQFIAGGLPIRVLKRVKNILSNKEGLMNMSMRMSKGQLMAVLQGLDGQMVPSELVQELSGPLLRRLPLNKLDKANILSSTSFDQLVVKMWSRTQAAFLAKQMHDKQNLRWKLRSILQGVTCKMIDNVTDNEIQDMAQAVTETPQWLSKGQAGCAARRFFATKEKEKADYFKTITEDQLIVIPTDLLLHLPPMKVMDLPDSVCPVFLDKMQEANLSSLPHLSPSRPALVQRALLCLSKESDLSGLTVEDVLMLGGLLCEFKPLQLLRMAPAVLNFSLEQMASCQHIPRRHRAEIIQLVKQTFGDPSYWSAETMEILGPFILLDNNATSALPNKSWMKDVLYSLMSGRQYTTALRRKIFGLVTTSSNASATRTVGKELTVELIEELGMNNVYWTHTQLSQMSNQTFLTTFETLGAVSDYGADQLAVLSKKAIEVLGPVSQMNESVVMQMGCITRGFPNADLEKLPFSLDALEEIAKCGWNESQMQAVWKGVALHNNLTAQQLGAADMVALNQFICGLNSNEMEQLNVNAFKDAVGSMDGVHCSSSVAQQLKNLAVSAFGNPNTWTAAHVSELGNIIAGMNPTELASLDSAVFPFIRETSIPLITHFHVGVAERAVANERRFPHSLTTLSAGVQVGVANCGTPVLVSDGPLPRPPAVTLKEGLHFSAIDVISILQVLSAAQIEALGPDNAALVTSEQQASLSDEQLAALERAVTGTPDPTQRSAPSGTASLNGEGAAAFVKPFLLLLMGFLLL